MRRQLIQTLLWMTMNGSLIGLILILLRIALKCLPRRWTVYLWLVVFFRLICPFSVSIPDSVVPFAGSRQGDYSVIETNPEAAAYEAAVHYSGESTEILLPEIRTETGLKLVLRSDTEAFLIVLWLSGLLLMISVCLAQTIRLQRRLSKAANKGPRIFVTDELSGAILFGIIRPRIYLPAGCDGNIKEQMLLHEQMHVKYKDHILKFLIFCICILHWFNPLIWGFFRLFSIDLEMACDERVISHMTKADRLAYAKALASLYEMKTKAVFSLFFKRGNAADRIRGILNYKKPAEKKAAFVLGAFILLMIIFTFDSYAMSPPGGKGGLTEVVFSDLKPEVSAGGRIRRTEREALLDTEVGFTYHLKGYAERDTSSVSGAMEVNKRFGKDEALVCSVDCYAYNGTGAIVGMCHASKIVSDTGYVACSANGTCLTAPSYGRAYYTFQGKVWANGF